MLDSCFDYDWELTKIPIIVKNEEERNQIKAYLRLRYKMIRETYKFNSGIAPLGRIMCIGPQTLTEMMY